MKQIVVLGAGYAGLRLALDLERALRAQAGLAQVTLIDRHPYHQIVQLLHLTATAGIHSREAIVELERLLHKRQIRFVQADVTALQPEQRQLALASGEVLSYDYLAVALGGTTNFFGLPGAAEHGLPLRTYDEALRLRNHVVSAFRSAAASSDPDRQRVLMTSAIVGGGFTGCQIAGELATWAPMLASETGAPRNQARVALLDRGPRLLAQFEPWAGEYAARSLDRLGVSFYPEMAVERVEAEKLVLGDGRVLRAATIIWAAGIKAPALLAAAGLPADRNGRLLVDRYLRVQGQARVFALGDCAAIPDGDGFVPATASYAMRQGSHLAAALFDELNERPMRAYEPLHLGELVSLGPNDAVGNPLGVPTTGQAVHLLKKGIEQYYRSTLDL